MITAQTTYRWECPYCGQYDTGYYTPTGAENRLQIHYSEECPDFKR